MSKKEQEVQLSPLLQSLVDAERRRPGYTPTEEARVWERIESSLAWNDSQPFAPRTAATSLRHPPERAVASRRGPARRPRLIAAAALLAILTLGGGSHAAYLAVARHKARSAPTAAPSSPRPLGPAPARHRRTGPLSTATPSAPSAPTASPPDGSRIARERELLEMARAALGLQRLPEARVALEQHRRAFPTGQLAEERDSLTVQLLIALGELDEARAAAAWFHANHPASIFWPSMEQQLDQAARPPAPRMNGE